MNQDDPQLVRDGAPAYLLMLDSFVEGAPENEAVLRAAAELYSAYGVVFVDDPLRARKLTTRGRDYGRRALCAAAERLCGSWDLPYAEFARSLQDAKAAQVPALYVLGLSWMAWIQAHGDASRRWPAAPGAGRAAARRPWTAASRKPHRTLPGGPEHHPPTRARRRLRRGRAFQRALEVSRTRPESRSITHTIADAANGCTTVLHEVLDADPGSRTPPFNTLGPGRSRELLASADDYF
jgi:hypothetical protein